MATQIGPVDTQHEDLVHDAQFDYYGRRLATCSSDRTIRVFDVGTDAHQLISEIKGHEGPVWGVAWSHPKFGSLLASCSYDRKVKIWKQSQKNDWVCAYEYTGHELSVNSLSWAPHDYGLILAAGSSDGHISIISHKENGWEGTKFPAHQIGVNAVSWLPSITPSSLINPSVPQTTVKRLASAGSDNLVKVWRFAEGENVWKNDKKDILEGHNDWVRDVAAAPSIGLPSSLLATASQDGNVIIWSQDESNGAWQQKKLPRFGEVVWRVSWSVTGNILAVSSGDAKVSLWKESPDGEWAVISSLDEGENLTPAS